MSHRLKARIIGMGAYLPKRIFSNQDFEKMMDTTDEWITTRTGIKERRIAAADEFTADMGTAAARKALEQANFSVEDVEFILVATMTPDYTSSSVAALVQGQLGAEKAGAMDLQAACTGFVYALSTAKAFVEAGIYRNVLVVAAEKMSSFVDYEDRGTSVLFGDGAAAAVVTASGQGLAIDTVSLGANGSMVELIIIPGGGTRHPATNETVAARMHYFKMQGKEVFKQAVRCMLSAARDCMTRMHLSDEQIRWVVPHQANLRIIDAVAKGFNISADKVYKTVHKYGNTSASSVAIALKELMEEHTLHPGEHILLVAFGAGLTWGAAILTYVKD